MTSMGDIVEQRSKHFEELFKAESIPSLLEEVPEISGVLQAEVVRNLHNRRLQRWMSFSQRWKALDKVEVVLLTHLFCVAWRSGAVPLVWALLTTTTTTTRNVPIIGESHSSASQYYIA